MFGIASRALLPRFAPAARTQRVFCSGVNELYRPNPEEKINISQGKSSGARLSSQDIIAKHFDPAVQQQWETDGQKIKQAVADHSLFTWGASNSYLNSAIPVVRSSGIYFWDTNNKRYIDFNAQAMCVNIGHSHPKVADAVYDQMNRLAYMYPCVSMTPIKAKLSALLADIFPGDLNTFFYPSGGSEANESAIRMAKQMTGRHKILARYRSYHGSTLGSLSLTGDPRRWLVEPSGMPGVVHFFDPWPYSFSWGQGEEEVTERSLRNLREVVTYEGGHNIAAIIVESVTGTNGVLKPPHGYLQGLRDLCDEHGILLISDEVMAGFGRTGKMFGFEHGGPGVIPDIVTMAKGINGAHVPLGAVAVRDHVADHFRQHPIGFGSTYNSHPVGLASAFAGLQVLLEENMVENAARLEPVMVECMQHLKSKHPCVKQGRALGLFGILDLQKNRHGHFLSEYNAPMHPAMAKLKSTLQENGLFTMLRWSSVYCVPPLMIDEEQLRHAFDIVDRSLHVVDQAMEDL